MLRSKQWIVTKSVDLAKEEKQDKMFGNDVVRYVGTKGPGCQQNHLNMKSPIMCFYCLEFKNKKMCFCSLLLSPVLRIVSDTQLALSKYWL